MKEVKLTYHTTTVAESNQLNITVPDSAVVHVLDARSIAGADTRWQFVIQDEAHARSRGDGRNS